MNSPARINRRSPWIWMLVWLGATLLLVAFHRPFEWREVAAHMQQASPIWILLALIANGMILVLWSSLWRRFLPRSALITRKRMGEIILLTAASMNTLPFMGGHALATGLLAKRGGVGFGIAATVMTLDQLCEGLSKVILIFLAMAVAPVPDWMRSVALSIGGGMLVLLIVLAWIANRPPAGSKWLHRLSQYLEILTHPRRWIGGLFLSAAIKLAEAAAIYAVLKSFGVNLPIESSIVVLTFVNLATMVSVSPGNLGIYEAAAYAAYSLLGLAPDQAVALALVQHGCFLFAMIVPGYLLTGWRAWRSSRASA